MGPLPPAITLSSAGLLSGTPALATGGNTYQFTIRATNGVPPDATQLFSLQINRPPVAGANNFGTPLNTAAVLPNQKILLSSSDPDGDPLIISSVAPTSTQGGTVTLGASSITYLPPTNYLGNDSFTYTLSDGRGGLTPASIQVLVSDPNVPTLNIVSLTIGSKGVTIVAQGVRRSTYKVQATDSLAQPFVDISGTLPSDTTGRITFVDARTPAALPPARFYRVVSAP